MFLLLKAAVLVLYNWESSIYFLITLKKQHNPWINNLQSHLLLKATHLKPHLQRASSTEWVRKHSYRMCSCIQKQLDRAPHKWNRIQRFREVSKHLKNAPKAEKHFKNSCDATVTDVSLHVYTDQQLKKKKKRVRQLSCKMKNNYIFWTCNFFKNSTTNGITVRYGSTQN